MAERTYEIDMTAFPLGAELDLDLVWSGLRVTNVVARGSKILCTGPWW